MGAPLDLPSLLQQLSLQQQDAHSQQQGTKVGEGGGRRAPTPQQQLARGVLSSGGAPSALGHGEGRGPRAVARPAVPTVNHSSVLSGPPGVCGSLPCPHTRLPIHPSILIAPRPCVHTLLPLPAFSTLSADTRPRPRRRSTPITTPRSTCCSRRRS